MIVDGQRVRALESNAAWASKQQNNTLEGVQSLNNPSSGGNISNAQQKINDIEGDVAINASDISALQTDKENKSEKGLPDGYASLGGDGKLLMSEIPDSIIGAMEFKGMWDADANLPFLEDGVGTPGDVYQATLGGTVDFGSGNIDFTIGDFAIYNGTVWEKIEGGLVQNVNGQVGVVVLDTDDIDEGVTNLYFTNARADARIANAVIDALSDVDTTTNPPTAGQALIYDAVELKWVPGASSGGGGGGGSLRWTEGAPAPIEVISSNVPVRRFPDGEDLYMYAAIRVPTSYVAGDPITCKVPFLSSGTADTVLVKSLTTLIRTGTDAITSTTNQHTSTNAAATLTVDTVDEPTNATLDLSDGSGEINSAAVSPGDLLIVRLTRDVATDTATADVDVILDASEVLFT